MPEQSKLELLAELLQRHGVEFLVIGGQAEILMGGARVTYDIDICYRRDAQNLHRLAAAISEINPSLRGAPADLPFQFDAHVLAFGNNYTLNTSLGPVDLHGWVEPLGAYEALLPKSESFVVGGIDVTTIGLEDLIQVKQHIGRSKDRESLLQLLAIRSIRERQQEG